MLHFLVQGTDANIIAEHIEWFGHLVNQVSRIERMGDDKVLLIIFENLEMLGQI